MNVAVFADLHGRILLAFLLCARWERETGEHITCILQAGDLGAYPRMNHLDRATIRHAESDPTELGFVTDFATYQAPVAEALATTTCPMLFVRGNHEDHEWLDSLERTSSEPAFLVDAYKRILCLKTGMPYTIRSGSFAMTVLGIGRIGAPVGAREGERPQYIQPYEQDRLLDMGQLAIDVVLTHDTLPGLTRPGYGMDEIRLILDAYRPPYHFYGHTEQPFQRHVDANGMTESYRMADLNWERQMSGRPLSPGVMGIVRWRGRDNHDFEVVDAPWLRDYTWSAWKRWR